RQAMIPSTLPVLQDVPDQSAKALPVDFNVLAQSRPQVSDAIPFRTEHRPTHDDALRGPLPHEQAQPIDEGPCPDPDQQSLSGTDLAYSFHAGAQPLRVLADFRFG